VESFAHSDDSFAPVGDEDFPESDGDVYSLRHNEFEFHEVDPHRSEKEHLFDDAGDAHGYDPFTDEQGRYVPSGHIEDMNAHATSAEQQAQNDHKLWQPWDKSYKKQAHMWQPWEKKHGSRLWQPWDKDHATADLEVLDEQGMYDPSLSVNADALGESAIANVETGKMAENEAPNPGGKFGKKINFVKKCWNIVGGGPFYVKGKISVGGRFSSYSVAGGVYGQIDVKVFHFKATVLKGGFHARVHPKQFGGEGATGEWGFYLQIMGMTVVEEIHKLRGVTIGGACPKNVFQSPKSRDDWPPHMWRKTMFKFEKRMMLGPVPVKITIEVIGGMGYQIILGAHVGCDKDKQVLIAGLQPIGELVVKMEAAVDVGIASAGIEGVLEILKGGPPIYVTGGSGKICGHLDIELQALSGKIFLFVQVMMLGKFKIKILSWDGPKIQIPIIKICNPIPTPPGGMFAGGDPSKKNKDMKDASWKNAMDKDFRKNFGDKYNPWPNSNNGIGPYGIPVKQKPDNGNGQGWPNKPHVDTTWPNGPQKNSQPYQPSSNWPFDDPNAGGGDNSNGNGGANSNGNGGANSNSNGNGGANSNGNGGANSNGDGSGNGNGGAKHASQYENKMWKKHGPDDSGETNGNGGGGDNGGNGGNNGNGGGGKDLPYSQDGKG